MSSDEVPSVAVRPRWAGSNREEQANSVSDGSVSDSVGGSSSQGSSEHGDSFDQRSSRSGSTNTTSTSVDSGGSTVSWMAKTQDLLFTVWDLTRAKVLCFLVHLNY